jgi:hypothetical protein
MKSPIPIAENMLRENTVKVMAPKSFFTQWIRVSTREFKPGKRKVCF